MVSAAAAAGEALLKLPGQARIANDAYLDFARQFPGVTTVVNKLNLSTDIGTAVGMFSSMIGKDGLRVPRAAGVKDGVVLWETALGSGVMTIGNNMIVAGSSTAARLVENQDLWDHEYNHSIQWATLGSGSFVSIWTLGVTGSLVTGKMGPGGGGCANLIEWSAGAEGTTYNRDEYANGCRWLS